ncbi:MAG: glycoside hydrolase family 15 protein [Acidimicrobiia bacterium]|nr:glycoside hydrolase family 15 protein [Acidimicrobiia bacterium]
MLAQAVDRETGAVVASITTQPPYALDWIRDGAYLNEALLAAGHPRAGRAAQPLLRRDDRAARPAPVRRLADTAGQLAHEPLRRRCRRRTHPLRDRRDRPRAVDPRSATGR